MSVEQLFLNHKGIALYTTILKPDSIEKQEGYVIVHPFAEEKKSAHRILFELANLITEQGYYVLMFDLSGCGDSEGNLLATTLDDWFEELECLNDYFQTSHSLHKVHYLGLRLGAFMAGIYRTKTRKGERILMLEPVINPEEYFRKVLKSKLFKELLTQGNISSKRNELIDDLKKDKSLDFDGHEIGTAFYKSIVLHKDEFYAITMDNISLINISLTGKVSKEYQRLIDEGIVKKENLQTLKMEPFWERIESSPDISELKKLVVNCL
jgi:esterase/lipase